MLNLRNINPMVRAVGTMGAVAALTTGITFAQLTSNTVALSSNTLSTGSANLEIGAVGSHHNNNNTDNTTGGTSGPLSNDTTMGGGSCTHSTNGTIPGFNLTGSNGLLPGVQSDPLKFCLKNTSDVPLVLTATIPDDPFTTTAGLQPSDITLAITCGTGSASATLDAYNNTTSTESLGTLDANSSTNCQATVELNSSATITGTESLPSFDIEFTGTMTS